MKPDKLDNLLALATKPDLSDQIGKWMTWLKVEKNVSPHTLRAYINDVTQFLEFLHDHFDEAVGINTLSNVRLADFRSWLSRKSMDGLAASSRARSLSGVKNFLKWLDKTGVMHNAHIGNVRSPKLPHKLPKPLELPQAFRLLDISSPLIPSPLTGEGIKGGGDARGGDARGAKEKGHWTHIRNTALFTLLYACGLRISEALNLNISDLPRVGFLIVMGKLGNQRTKPFIIKKLRTAKTIQ